jgi:predicted glycosyltransferase
MDRQPSKIESEPLSLMTYSHDGYGLGHLRRTSTIAARFVREMPGSTVLMLTACPAGNIFLLPEGVDFIKIPSLVKVDTGVFAPQGLRVSRKKAKAIRTSIIKSAVSRFKPHIFLVDHVPNGVYGELLPTLETLRELDDPPVIALGLRDILDDPKVLCELWRREKTYEALRKYYDEVLIYGCKEIFDTGLHYGLDAEVPGRIKYCGYVCAEEPLKTRERVRGDLRLQKEKLIVVTAGGGRDAYSLMQSCMEAFRHLGKDLPFEVVFITGPLMDPQQRECLRTQARGVGVRVFTWVEDPPSFVNAADMVITMAGYNSLCEVVDLKKKALVVPRLGPSGEQRTRARVFQERGLIDMLDPREVSARNLARRIMQDLERTDLPLPHATLEMGGARNAACRLSGLALERAGVKPIGLSRSHPGAGPRTDRAPLGWSSTQPTPLSPGK